MSRPAATALGVAALGVAAYLAYRRFVVDSTPLEEIRVTARRMDDPTPLEPITITAQRLPEPGIVSSVTGAVVAARDWLSMQIGDGIDAARNLMKPRGLRNHNPGNLRAGIAWKGLATPDRDSGGYAIFQSDAYGVRALGKDLSTKVGRGLNTIRKILNVYAPTFENNTAAYISAVARELGIGADAPLPWPARRVDLVAAIIRHENGQQPFARADLERWVALP